MKNKKEKEEKEEEKEKEKDLISYEPKRSWLCTKYKDKPQFQTVLPSLDLTPVQRDIIKSRYLNLLENFQKRSRNYTIVFYAGHAIVTIGALLVPALLSILNTNTMGSQGFTIQIYWATFLISLCVTICNGILTLFRIDKKYYFLNTAIEKLRSEGWQFVGLTGRYASKPDMITTHQNQFVYFIHYVEKMKMKQVEEEYYKVDEKSNDPKSNPKTELYSPSPIAPISSMMEETMPEPIKEAMNSMIYTHTVDNTKDIKGIKGIKGIKEIEEIKESIDLVRDSNISDIVHRVENISNLNDVIEIVTDSGVQDTAKTIANSIIKGKNSVESLIDQLK